MAAIEIDRINATAVRFTIGTLVTSQVEYQVMLDSFYRGGFTEPDCEFIYVDNTGSNKYDAFSGLNKILAVAKGLYVILCHQDVEILSDNIHVLEKKIAEMDKLDPKWAILSNAGGLTLKKRVECVTYPDKENTLGTFPTEVNTIDENFILIRRDANLGFSSDMTGYHLYGTDLCVLARARGYRAWVIGFRLLHKSKGNPGDTFLQGRTQLIKKYNDAFRARYLRTPCTIVFVSGSTWLAAVMNTKLLIFISRFILKIRKGINRRYQY